MNTIKATISDIKSMDNLSIVSFEVDGHEMKMMSLGVSDKLSVGSSVSVGVKASSIILAKGLDGLISTSNKLKCKVESVENGSLLSSVKFKFDNSTLESVITKDSSLRMNLQKGDEVLALIKASELFIINTLKENRHVAT